MKKMKKLASLILAVLMVLSMTVAAFAENTDKTPNKTAHDILIYNPENTYQYEAYQVFSGDFYDGKLSNITWGANVKDNATNLLDALKADAKIGKDFENCSNAEEVAEVLKDYGNDSSKLEAFAEIVKGNLTGTGVASTVSAQKVNKEGFGEKYEYTMRVTGDGYYLVKDAEDSVGNGEAYAKFMLQVVGTVTINAKVDAPTIDKKITATNDDTDGIAQDGKTNNASVGDVVKFEVTSKVPAMDGYDKYFFIVKDTLSKGLTFKYDVVVKIGDATIDASKYTVTPTQPTVVEDPTGDTEIEIVFKDFLKEYNKAEYIGKPITITYSATLNKNAVIGVEGNPNTVKLQYSNNPNVENKPDKDNQDKPDPKFPIGETPESTTYTYVTGIELTKIDATTEERLIGAEFKITGTKLNTVLVRTDEYTPSINGEYYALKDGSYTKTVPIDNPVTDEDKKFNADYKDINTKYAKEVKTEIKETKEKVEAKGFVGADGVLRFEGLGAGEYVIEEITAPDGYNKLKDKLNVNITWGAPDIKNNVTNCTWTVTGADGVAIKDGIVTLTVKNNAGALLPSTGGIGTTIFYAAGIILMAGAVFFVVRRKRA